MLVARCLWKYISRHQHWDRPPNAELCFRFTLDMLCSMATANHSISFWNCGESISCTWPQRVGQGKIRSIVEALEPHGSRRTDSRTRSNIEQLLCKLTRVLEIAGSKVRLKVYEGVCFRSVAIVLVALQLSRSWIRIVLWIRFELFIILYINCRHIVAGKRGWSFWWGGKLRVQVKIWPTFCPSIVQASGPRTHILWTT